MKKERKHAKNNTSNVDLLGLIIQVNEYSSKVFTYLHKQMMFLCSVLLVCYISLLLQ